jgi:hypothetical protein
MFNRSKAYLIAAGKNQARVLWERTLNQWAIKSHRDTSFKRYKDWTTQPFEYVMVAKHTVFWKNDNEYILQTDTPGQVGLSHGGYISVRFINSMKGQFPVINDDDDESTLLVQEKQHIVPECCVIPAFAYVVSRRSRIIMAGLVWKQKQTQPFALKVNDQMLVFPSVLLIQETRALLVAGNYISKLSTICFHYNR